MIAAPAFGLPGVFEMLIVAIMGSGIGVPLGVPPQDPDPVMLQIAPAECLYYTTWMGMAQPAGDSANQTEQLLAEEEVQAFVAEVERAINAGMQAVGAQAPNADARLITANLPLLVRTLVTHPTTLFVERFSVQELAEQQPPLKVELKAALVVNLQDDAARVGDVLEEFLERVPPDFATAKTVGETDYVEIALADPAAPRIAAGRKDGYLIIAVGSDTFAEVVGRMGQPIPRWLSDEMQALPVPRLCSFASADLAAIVQLVARMGGAEITPLLDALGISSLQKVVSVSGLDETGFVNRTQITSSNPDQGLGSLLSGQRLAAEDLAPVPADATVAVALRMDLAQLLTKTRGIMMQFQPEAAQQFQTMLGEMGQPMGIDVERDLLAALGDVWTLHTAPSSGGLVAGWTLAVQVKDADKLAGTNQQVVRFFNAVFGGQELIRSHEFRGHTMHLLEIPEEEFFLTPTWCVTDSHLVVTLLPQAMKSYLNRLEDARSLAQVPAVASRLEQADGPYFLAYHDLREPFVTFYPLAQYGAQLFARELRRGGFDFDATTLPSVSAVAPHLGPSVSSAHKRKDGFESYSHSTLPGVNVGTAAPVLMAALVPIGMRAQQSAQEARAANNLRQLALAMHNYHDVYKALPAGYSADESKKPLLSWRVYVLPFLEQSALYEQFHLDEPWDSPHNRKLIAQMPAVYESPHSNADPGKTVYLGNAHQRGIFCPPQRFGKGNFSAASGVGFRNITDGTSNTIMLVEVNDAAAVIWTKPGDFEPNADDPARGLRVLPRGLTMIGLCDGSVFPVRLSLPADTWKALFTRDGHEIVEDFWQAR